MSSRRLPLRLDVSRKAVEDRLPATLLLLDRVGLFGVEHDADDDAVRTGHELDLGLAIAENIFDQLVLDDRRVGAGEVKTHAAVPGFHARREYAAFAQVDRRLRRMPVVR